MNEVEKMYENAGLSNMWVERYNDGYYEHERYYNSYKEMINNMIKANDWTLSEAQEVAKRECKKEHPPFTAEKQLELIKWLGKNKNGFNVFNDTSFNSKEKHYWCCADQYYEDFNYGCHKKEFSEALAGLINELPLTEEERKQIKNILESEVRE